MMQISSAVLEDSSQFIKKNCDADFDEYFFNNNKELFIIKNPSKLNSFLNFLSLKQNDFSYPLKTSSNIEIKKTILIKFLKLNNPLWLNKIKWGIKTTVFDFLKENNYNLFCCLLDCKLISLEKKVIRWWYDNLATSKDNKIEIGLDGEFLSYKYENEFLEINKENLNHISLKKSDVGYDIKSVISKSNLTAKPIEVKATTRINNPTIFLTRNEWEKSHIPNYLFHLWILDKKKNLAHLFFIKPQKLKNSISIDKGEGRWKVLEIPVKSFCDKEEVTFKL